MGACVCVWGGGGGAIVLHITSCFCRKVNAANCIHLTWPTQERTLGTRRDAILNHPSHMISQKSGFDGYTCQALFVCSGAAKIA